MEHKKGIKNMVQETLTLNQLHRQMGHASIQVNWDLVAHGMVIGLRLEYTPIRQPFFCKACIYGKATRKFIPKIREGKRAAVFGGEVHSDLWGKSPVESRGGKNYMDTYIDNKTHLTHVHSSERRMSNPLHIKPMSPG
jgi:hypothetical protein